jgi:tetraacyldisaccharide 4'-kinase
VVLSGYGRDEVLLHRRWHPDVPVYAGRERRPLLEQARTEGAEVVVMDDGFQHRAAPRDLDLVLVAAEHAFPGRVLPWGRYREPARALGRADVLVVTRRSAGVAQARALERRARMVMGNLPSAGAVLAPHGWLDISGAPASEPEGPVLALASVASPDAFLQAVRGMLPGTDVRLREFPDHHGYSDEELRALLGEAHGRTLVTTEKDAVKLAAFGWVPDSTRVLEARIRWDWDEDRVRRALDQLVGASR